eukprot:gene16948-19314_t
MGAVSSIISSDTSISSDVSQVAKPQLSKGCDLIVLDEGARNAFMKFYDRGDWHKNLGDEVTEESIIQMHNEYKLPEGIALSNFEEKFSVIQSNSNVDYFQAGTFLTPLLVAALFPLFLMSQEYADWILSQTSGSDCGVVEQAKRIGRLKTLFAESPCDVNPNMMSNSVVADALKSGELELVKKEIESGSWLESLVTMVEDLPLCVSIATANGTNKGFPLIYVNNKFESMTGYDRSEIVNKNCRFLQSTRTEPNQIKLMTEALRLAKPVKVAITNVRKDGTEFGNLLAMKPVFDSEGVYTYVIGVQCDISDPTVSHRTMRVVEDLLSILPNILN